MSHSQIGMLAIKTFVCGATGSQGGATAAVLLSSGGIVHSLTRDSSTSKAQAAAAEGVKLFQGGYDDTKSLAAALESCDAAFINMVPNFADPGAELRQGTAVIAACKMASVRSVVYISGLGTNAPEGLHRWHPNSSMANMIAAKNALEEQVRLAGFTTWIILRPGHLNTDCVNPHSPSFDCFYGKSKWMSMATKDTKMPIIDPTTIGVLAAAAFLDAKRFHQELPIADELLGFGDIMEKFSLCAGRKLQVRYYTDYEIENLLKMTTFFIAQLRTRD